MRFIAAIKEYAGIILRILKTKARSLISRLKQPSQHLQKNDGTYGAAGRVADVQDTGTGTTPAASAEIKKILVSYCLYGEKTVRYDGRELPLTDPVFLKWKEEGRLVPVCPEVDGGLPVPRLPSERSGKRVLCLDGRDVTREYQAGAIHALQAARKNQIAFAVMKEGSPSCGSSSIHDGRFMGEKIHGEGLTVELLRNAGIIVFSENDLEEAADYLTGLEAVETGKKETRETITIRSGIMKGTVK